VGATAQVTPRPVEAKLNVRENVAQLTADRLSAFAAGLRALMDRRDNRGYQFYAGWHGVPFALCEHHDELFLPWHRGYLYHIETALQDAAGDGGLTFPWWDWIDEPGIPAAFTDAVVGGRDSALLAAAITPFGIPSQPDWPTETYRETPTGPGPLPLAPPLRGRYDWLMEPKSYPEFNRRLWFLHDNVHVWVGGTMGDQNWAAYDPLFWSHHCMVDRLWRIWQHNNPGALPPRSLLDTPMTFAHWPSFTVRDVLDVNQLGVEYAGVTQTVGGTS
jgi:tyrosinase